jgi:preprotein translocase subunit SecG
MDKIEKMGVALTFIWLTTIATLIFLKWDSAKCLSLNEWGDFLAGVTAPLAFLWLIIGYMLQRQELKNNTEALFFQRDEMAKQAIELKEQNKHLAATAEATSRNKPLRPY